MTDILDTTEQFFSGIGFRTPATRFLAGSGIGAAVVFAAKPSAMFTPSGEPREWSLISEDEDATPFPWYMGVIVPGALLGLLV